MAALLDSLHPSGWTGRRAYAIALGICALALVAVWIIADSTNAPRGFLFAPWAFAYCAMVLLTIRRLRDAGVSVWIALLFLFPIDISVDIGTIAIGALQVGLLDFSALIRAAPVLLGLLGRSRPLDERVI